MFPFGRMARDVFGEGNLRENPSRIPEKIFGIPLQQLQRQATQSRKNREKEEEAKQRLIDKEQWWR